MERYRISGVPVTDADGRLVGILTNRDLRFCTTTDLPIRELMTKSQLVTVPVGTTLEQAKELLHKHRIEKLPVVDSGLSFEGSDHGQGHPEADQVPRRKQGSLRADFASAQRWESQPTRWSARRRSSTLTSICSRWTRRMATVRACCR